MCLAVVALDAHPAYPLVVAANRDEYHARAAAPAAWWPQGLLAGRDLVGGGTWLALARDGRFAFLTNVRDPARHDPAAASRGALVPALLAGDAPLPDRLERLRTASQAYNGFNLVAGSATGIAWMSNRAGAPRALARGVHGISNGSIDDDWPKVRRMREALAHWAGVGATDFGPLFAALADRSTAPDVMLPATGVSLDWERRLSAVFITGEDYGTRCSTVLAIARDGEATFVERSFTPGGRIAGEVVERFAVAQRSARSITT